MFAAIYSRSSLGKVKQGDTAENQVAIVKEYARRFMPEVVFDERFTYVDDGQSGFKTTFLQRPEMRKLLKDIEDGFVDIVFFKGISRFARDAGESIQTAKRLIQKGVRVISIEENYDSNKNDPTFFQFYAVMAEAESRKTSVRISLSNKEKSRQGLYMSSTTPFGYIRVKELPEPKRTEVLKSGKHPLNLWVQEEEAYAVRKMFDMYLGGSGRPKIAFWLNNNGYVTRKGKPFTEIGIRRMLMNPVYTGTIVYGMRRIDFIDSEDYEKKIQKTEMLDESEWAVCQNAHPAIISLEEAEKVRRLMMEREQFFNNKKETGRRLNNAKHPLVGILKCGKCGSGMICHKRTVKAANGESRHYRYYVCPTRRRSGVSVCNQENINADEIEEAVYADIIFKLKQGNIDAKVNKTKQKKQKNETEKELKNINDKIAIFRNKAKRLLDNSDVYDDDTFRKLNLEIKEEVKKLESSKLELENRMKVGDNIMSKQEVNEILKKFMDTKISNLEELKESFHEVLESITIKGDELIVKTKFPIS